MPRAYGMQREQRRDLRIGYRWIGQSTGAEHLARSGMEFPLRRSNRDRLLLSHKDQCSVSAAALTAMPSYFFSLALGIELLEVSPNILGLLFIMSGIGDKRKCATCA